MDDADRVVVELRGIALEDRAAMFGLGEPEAERLRDRGLWKLAGDHLLHDLETR